MFYCHFWLFALILVNVCLFFQEKNTRKYNASGSLQKKNIEMIFFFNFKNILHDIFAIYNCSFDSK